MSLLDIEGLGVAFEDEDGHPLPAVQNVSFSLEKGAVTCLVGESGCGKSLTARAILGILPRGATAAGSVRFEDRELIGLPEKNMSHLRGRSMAMIFQEPMTALNPVLTVGEQAAEPLRLHLSRRALHRLSARALGRHAPARHDSHGPHLPAVTPARR